MKRDSDSYHCSDCDVCIDGYDHHCPWTGKCIGKGNKLPFMAFIIHTCFFFNFLININFFSKIQFFFVNRKLFFIDKTFIFYKFFDCLRSIIIFKTFAICWNEVSYYAIRYLLVFKFFIFLSLLN